MVQSGVSFILIIYIIKLLRGILHLLLDFSFLISALFPLFPYKGTNHADFRSFLSSLRNFYFIFIILFFKPRNGVTIERSIGRKKKEKCFYLILMLKFVSNYPSYNFFFMILFRRNVTIKSWVIFKYRKKKFTFFSPLKWLKNPVHNFFFFSPDFDGPPSKKVTLPTKSWQIRLMVVLKIGEFVKKFVKKFPRWYIYTFQNLLK